MWPNPPHIFLYGRLEYTLQMLKTSALASPHVWVHLQEQMSGKDFKQKTCLLKKVAVTLVDAFPLNKKSRAPTQRYGKKNKPPNVFI